MKRIGIIGGGPAGLMAAICAKNKNNHVTIFDINDKVGKKLLMTGGGRCNITNSAYFDDFLENVVTNKKFIYSAFTNFDNFALIDFLNQNGLETIIEEDGRVFPKSEKAGDVVSFFENIIKEKSIDIKTKTKIKKVYKDKYFYLTDQNDKSYTFDYLIIATGGKSYPRTGSDGNGYSLASKLGHKIIDPRAVLVPIYLNEKLSLRAQSFKDVSLNIKTNVENITVSGDLLINGNLITGPAALKASSFILGKNIVEFSIDFSPDLTYNEIEKKILDLIGDNPKKTLGNALKPLINFPLFEEILRLGKIDINKNVSELTKEDRKTIVSYIKDFKIDFDRIGSFESAVVTRGGIDLKEVNPQNMESKLVDGLFFVGEILDIDSLTGGFNLQTYISTAYAAGTFIKENT
ncbi:BaiN/RdsA family NAD(P)/FAD-dependent oxidoreductase [Anaerococcus degeneri]|uniref:NAD(P)/FAD-dependent oxidoreductase n=1 Tax=Anaerococcus degeneri TaxID=361500 RepID=A0ABS7YUG2_9FIRM|nr:NAD(P)/FAD-dependent oxidoreductase [Anaerococcus degeneri]MBP2015110.1 putative Rossmann fold flavoprotein [Anaerococcus degeneri]MCA2095370.1 NAD(P)/FAD-dependent oxidoreductase [Anaerococcus degeneri]